MRSHAIVVLGCQVYRGHPSRLLASRLDAAVKLAAADPAVIVVSGKNEAWPMFEYLVARGIDPVRIIVENEATSTNENLENAHRLLGDAVSMLVVTNDFHILRTKVWAWHLGLTIRTHSATSPPPHRQRAFVREVFALPHSTLRVLWRKWVACRGQKHS
ncbi:YdcF family protein [Corynebacterium felinum]|uniref:Uncharacterized SAM-binding protein YcdF (DUF218 family) n=1 Tax=Corynebacterium felinum TaxID=131318 RepID=A0ABU2B8D0_9CORY|nr:YdcF family protein [Corynebacterium felinum]MDF5820232.1 YdcF family protein [Corynebacterium felinum]MDR7354873.1 uncharacterized SAM-binding protein YcdF (DUF218 family) [Corynebacterium felinum]